MYDLLDKKYKPVPDTAKVGKTPVLDRLNDYRYTVARFSNICGEAPCLKSHSSKGYP